MCGADRSPGVEILNLPPHDNAADYQSENSKSHPKTTYLISLTCQAQNWNVTKHNTKAASSRSLNPSQIRARTFLPLPPTRKLHVLIFPPYRNSPPKLFRSEEPILRLPLQLHPPSPRITAKTHPWVPCSATKTPSPNSPYQISPKLRPNTSNPFVHSSPQQNSPIPNPRLRNSSNPVE